MVPLGLRRLWAGELILDYWCERAGIPSGTTFDQLDGQSVVPEKPENLRGLLRGRLTGSSVGRAPLVPLSDWPNGLRLEEILSPSFARRVPALPLSGDHGAVVLLTVGEFLNVPRFGPNTVIRFGCEVEAGVHAFLADGSLPPWAEAIEGHRRKSQTIPLRNTPTLAPGSSVPDLVEARFGVKVECSLARFEELGWTFQGECDIGCGDCDSEVPFVIYRKPYTTPLGSYRYWAIVCLNCRSVMALNDFESDDKKAFRTWDMEDAVQEVNPEAPEEPEADLGLYTHLPEPSIFKTEGALDSPTDTPSPEPPSTKSDLAVESPSEALSVGAAKTVDRVVITAAQAEFSASSGQARQVDVGRAKREDSEPSVVFRVVGPSVDLSEQPPGEIFLAVSPDDGSRYKVQIRYASATEVVVVADDEVSTEIALHLFLLIDPGIVPKAFFDFLEACNEPRLAAVLAGHGQLSAGAPENLPGLNAEQRKAAGAITSPGVSVVWGPPGTGKTRVIGAAVAELLRRGKSVALVSNTNVAVDQALLHVCRSAEPFEAGEILRVGYPSIPQVSEHPMLLSSKAIQIKFRDLVEELGRLQIELNSVREAAAVAEAGRLDELLRGHNIASLEELVLRQRGLSELAHLNARVEILTTQLGELKFLRERAGKRYDQARASCARWADYLAVLEDEREVASLSSVINACERKLDEINQRLRQANMAARIKHHRAVRRLAAARKTAETTKTTAIAKRETHLQHLYQASQQGVTPAAIRADQAKEEVAESGWLAVKKQIAEINVSLQQLNVELGPLLGLTALTKDEVLILGHIDRCGSARHLVKEARDGLKASAHWIHQIRGISSKIEGLQRKLHDQEATLITEAKVIGTTLAQLVLHRGLIARSFDYVVIDEASSALPPYVYAAMTKAEVGCTLVGDFEQNWPITHCNASRLPAHVADWLVSNPFALLGIRTSSDATSNDGCVVLRDQYRFGSQTMRLANAVAYGGLLRHGRHTDLIPIKGPEVVIIDTSTLEGGALAEKGPMGSGRWWAVGAALSCELAKRHNFEGVGVVTPYRHQVQLTRAQLNDGGGTAVQAGTAHAFQGREFPVVIADLVEDGTGNSWVARGDRLGSPWTRTGVRIFNVAVTRNAGRLYVICNAGSVQSARSGPLSELGAIIRSGDAEVWDARTVLGHPIYPTIATIEVSMFGQRYMPEILNDGAFYDSLLRDLDTSTQRVVIFSPFVTQRRLEQILPVLRTLMNRGVLVTVFTKAAHELRDPQLLTAMRDEGVVVHERHGMHEKVVIVDHDVTYVGSLNLLSNTGRTGEIMLRLKGQDTTGKIAQWMRSAARNRR